MHVLTPCTPDCVPVNISLLVSLGAFDHAMIVVCPVECVGTLMAPVLVAHVGTGVIICIILFFGILLRVVEG